ncbi:acyl-homoserine-lactone synthase [Chelativorans sp. J32]|uniref:acyl-homoserine-lactone synthase n=1 Tax=Chelativorans sp. J32 TaxID=935840 RepID=UPI000484E8ED|nr:acyl-homoserine-lactone synthase [Chelativorans sp. J32]
MFISIAPDQIDEHADVLDQMFRLRKQVFHDALKWEVSLVGHYERDHYDTLGPVYLAWYDPERVALYASMRLLPTTGPTLLFDVFRETMPDASLAAPGIWEATRACIHSGNLARDFPGMDAGKAFGILALAAIEWCRVNGVRALVANYEPAWQRIYDRMGAFPKQVGRAEGFGRQPVCCGVFEISDRVIMRMRTALACNGPVYHRQARELVAA